MSTGRRLAKRSIIGTRVCAPGDDAKFYSGVIQAVKTPAKIAGSNSIDLTPNTIYSVRFDSRQGESGVVRITGEFAAKDLIGPGFGSVLGVELVAGQKCFVTYNGREVSGEVCKHYAETDEVIISIQPNGFEAPLEVQKRLEEVRLLESRKSARLADQDTDFARLADMACDRKKTASHVIDVPVPPFPNGSRKRRTSSSNYSNYSNYDDNSEDELIMDECRAALVLMSLSCSPLTSSDFTAFYYSYPSPESSSSSSSSSSSDSSTFSYRSTPSPTPTPLGYSVHTISISSSFNSDEGIGMDYPEYPDEVPRKKRNLTRMIFQCTWPHCYHKTDTCDSIEAHIRRCHLKTQVLQFAEEEFYFTEVEYGNMASSPPTLSHQDMARPFHEDPDYQRLLVGNIRQSLLNQQQQQQQPLSPQPQNKPKLSPRPNSPKTPVSPRRVRGENKKCRKVYGMEHKEQWCTQCKWKKACTRFAE